MPVAEMTLMEVTDAQRMAIRKDVNLDSDEKLQKCISEVQEWYQEQSHLPRIELDPVLVERFLIARKGSVSQTKEKLDSMFSIRSSIPELASPRDIKHPRVQSTLKAVNVAPLPKLNHDNTRVTFCRYTNDAASYDLPMSAVYLFMIMEYRMRYDYTAGDRFVFDLKEKGWRHFARELPHVIIKVDKYMKASFGSRIKGIHLLNSPYFINKIMAMMKLLLPKKLMDRIQIHDTLEDLYFAVDREILPKDYGGNAKSLQEINDEWVVELNKDNVNKYLSYQENLRSDESKRIKKTI